MFVLRLAKQMPSRFLLSCLRQTSLEPCTWSCAMLAIEDVMVRYHRMKGDRTPGASTDHAAIATQSKVESW